MGELKSRRLSLSYREEAEASEQEMLEGWIDLCVVGDEYRVGKDLSAIDLALPREHRMGAPVVYTF